MNSAASPNPSQYTVVARRYRPQSFGDLVGQDQIARALSNAITQNRVGHAYLFTGARGVGKTSSARIFAKCLNCKTGPTDHPCNECDICDSVSIGEDVDVLEIDGASNRGIEEIRQLRSNANIRPSRSRFKIYIIDEVHMLTPQAFNALLKTLEEPPEHVKFIFCTTDPQKIPITVLSRCQRFDFSPVQTDEITKRLTEICEEEKITAQPDALRLLARRAGGSMRDSQSLLEQLFSFCGQQISVDQVHQLLGTADMSRISQLAAVMTQSDSASSLNLVAAAIKDGVDAGQLAQQLLGYFRDMMAVRVGASAETLLHCDESDQAALQSAADRLGLETILSIVQLLDHAVVRMQSSLHTRTLLEVAIVRICNLENLDLLADLVDQLSGIDQGITRPNKKASVSTPGSTAKKKAPAELVAPSTNFPSGSTPAHAPPSDSISAAEPVDQSRPQPITTIELRSDNLETVWQQITDSLGDMTSEIAAAYKTLSLPKSDQLVVTFDDQYTHEMCTKPERKQKLESALQRATGKKIRLDLLLSGDAATRQQETAKPRLTRMQVIRQLEQNSLVRNAIEVFDAEVVDFQRAPDSGD